jgi:hypothetical protein
VNGVDPLGLQDGPIDPIGAEGLGLDESPSTGADQSDWAEHGGAELLQNQGLEELKDDYDGCDIDCGDHSSDNKESEDDEQNCELSGVSGPATIVGPDGVEIPGVPESTPGVVTETGKGVVYPIPEGTPGLDPRVTSLRIMDPLTTGRYQYPNGYAVYMNESGQTVNPLAGRTISNADPFAHIPLP